MLIPINDQPETAVIEIRPKILFEKIEERFHDENVNLNVVIPSSFIGGMTLLESSILVSLTRLLSAKHFFEFGTYFGASSVLLASNSAADACVTTIDLPREILQREKQVEKSTQNYMQDNEENDNYLRNLFAVRGSFYIDRADNVIKRKIKRLFNDSRTLNPAQFGLESKFDFIFIDGGHDSETIRLDTENALKMAKSNCVIVWHDYRSTIHKEVTQFVDDFSQFHSVFHVQNTMLAFTLLGDFRMII
jgi:predicted O-methyltransferase YrrM